jgi:hypothetical protein
VPREPAFLGSRGECHSCSRCARSHFRLSAHVRKRARGLVCRKSEVSNLHVRHEGNARVARVGAHVAHVVSRGTAHVSKRAPTRRSCGSRGIFGSYTALTCRFSGLTCASCRGSGESVTSMALARAQGGKHTATQQTAHATHSHTDSRTDSHTHTHTHTITHTHTFNTP